LRYLHLVVHASQAVSVTLNRVEVREHLYPRTGEAYFRSDDPGLDALYRAGVRTVQLNSLDSYIDCPTREQRAWVGDAVVHQMVDLATNEDWGLARNYLELSDSPRPDGILPMVVAGDIEASGGLTILDWSLSWIHGLHIQYWHDGDLEGIRRHLPSAERVLRWYTSYLDERGTIAVQ
jgi:alpha-L-rhamnosidase